jgi:cytochrome bd ubiquinol oxidase subunit I
MPTLRVREHRIMDLDAVLLARLQFAFTLMVHIIFPAFTIGLSAYIATLGARSLKTDTERPAMTH